MIYEYAFCCSVEGHDSPFSLLQGISRKLLPCSTLTIGDASIEESLLIESTEEGPDLVDPLKFLPVSFEVCSIVYCRVILECLMFLGAERGGDLRA